MTGTRKLKSGRYSLLRRLGEGSQGETWEARDEGAAPPTDGTRPDPARLAESFAAYVRRARGTEHTNPRGLVAIKCFRVGQAKAWKDVELAEREANTLAMLDHPRLPRYLEHFEEEGALYLVMEKIEGESLRPGKTKGVDVIRMLEDVGDALRYIHGRSPALVHRDVKPGNVIRRPDGSYALVDFGAVRDRLKPAGGSTVVGTFGYMAPEQFQGRASSASDLYGLGATALAMLTGREPEELPHKGLGIDVARAVPRGTPRALTKTLKAMLAPDPDERAESIDEALASLRKTKGDKSRRERAARPRKKRRAKVARPARASRMGAGELAGFMGFLLAVGGLVYLRDFALAGALFVIWLWLAYRIRAWSQKARVRVAEEEARVRVDDDAHELAEDDSEETGQAPRRRRGA